MKNILGMSYMYHDSAAALLRDGEVLAAAAEERFIRIKHTVDFPVRAIEYVLEAGDMGINDLDAIVFYEKPFLKFERILKSHLMMFPRSYKSFRHFLPMWLNYKLRVPSIIRERTGYEGKVYFTDHHYAHAASAYLPSPFDRSLVLTTDGMGEWSTVAFGYAEGSRIHLERDIKFPHSLGLLYSSVTAHLGFKVNGGEGKVMGLASYGKPRFREAFRKLIRVRDDGSFQLDMSYFSFHHDLVMTNDKFAALLIPARVPESDIGPEHEDLAATLQAVTEEVIFKIVRTAHARYGIDKLCMAGGVALNCVANGKVLEQTPVTEVHVCPAAGDDGGAVGAALYLYSQMYEGETRWKMRDAYLGPSYGSEAIEATLTEAGVSWQIAEDDDDLAARVGALLADGKIIGWFQGRMEYGPRALGNRSILADPTRADMKDVLNAKVKHREGFRPFAPAILAEHRHAWFEGEHDSPFMLLAMPVREDKRDRVPAITHVDGTARVQTVHAETNPRFYKLIEAFAGHTGVPIVVNTSFNVRGEPIVCTPHDAYSCFARTRMDYLVMDRYIVEKPADAHDGRGR